MLDLALAVCCSLAIGMIFKVAGQRNFDRIALLTTNYLAAVVLASVLLAAGVEETAGGLTASRELLALGVTTGALFIAGFFIYALATQVAGMSLAVGVMRVSVVIPFLASWVIWNEVPTPAQGLGLVLAGVAFFMIARRDAAAVQEAPDVADLGTPSDVNATAAHSASSGVRVFAVLGLLFCAGGIVDVFMKTFDEHFAATNSRALFLLMVFGVAFLIGFGIVLWRGLLRGQWPERATLAWGVLLGVTNYGSVEFILRAIRQLSGPFVFPANNIALVIGAALLGVFFWQERLTLLNWGGLGLAAVALVLLNL
ncbi:MAG: hypothetical protein GVY18_05355 [Bacteroidetes bacterium]|jgi:drug/metabolite transporter (DMT)-like permease|nr:hypothetical protein [Bacteroidota bacterium]